MAQRIREMREIEELSVEELAQKTEVSVEEYKAYESGQKDLPFTFIHKCALAFGIELSDLLGGSSPHLSSYTVTRKGKGRETAKEEGIEIKNLAPLFRNKLGEPYWVKYEYNESLQNSPIHTTKHAGQEFDLVLSGKLKVRVGDNTEVLEEGDSIFYNSSTPHGMIAVDGKDCLFLAVVFNGENIPETTIRDTIASARTAEPFVCHKFIEAEEDSHGRLQKISFKNAEKFNFGFDVVDELANKYPDKPAMIHLDKHKVERHFTFKQMKVARHKKGRPRYACSQTSLPVLVCHCRAS